MIDSGSNPACLRRGRYYGFQSVPSVVTTEPGKNPIIEYGTNPSQFYASQSFDTFTVADDTSASIDVTPNNNIPWNLPYGLRTGWIVYIFGGLQIGKSTTPIDVKIQDSLAIVVESQSPGVDLTFRVGQSITLTLTTDNTKNMTAVITSFAPGTGDMVVDVTSSNGTGIYPNLPFGYWLVEVVGIPDKGTSVDWMLARVTSVDVTDPYNPNVSFEAYQSSGEGTYSFWNIVPQWDYARNYIRNENRVAFDASLGPSQNEYLGELGASFIPAQGQTTNENFDTSSPPTNYSGYTETTSTGKIIVIEDEYMAHRPYVGRAVSYKLNKVTNVQTTTITYDALLQPTYTTVSSEELEPLTFSYTFTNDDFKKTPPEKYTAGAAASYADGEIVSFPTPSRYVQDDTAAGTVGPYKSYEYTYTRAPFIDPADPTGPPVYLNVLIVIKNTSLADAPIPGKPTPQGFFWSG